MEWGGPVVVVLMLVRVLGGLLMGLEEVEKNEPLAHGLGKEVFASLI